MLERISLALIIVVGGLNLATAADFCGPLKTSSAQYGPYDYRTSKKQLDIVERTHFTSDVETLKHGSTGVIGHDIDYTLRASPNHPRALMAMMELSFRLKTDKLVGAMYTVPCYFDRAIRFAPDDERVYLIYGIYLSRSGDKNKALKQFQIAESIAKDDPNIQYNLGLIYFDLKDYPNARLHAKRAYELGFTLPGLRKALEDVGQWEVPLPAQTQDEKPNTPEPAQK